ncbi:hypothetical protein SAMN02910456_02031 [Ruminococcaceae bacterium YRB3002]|nr:hypothetical protein SAMN02910456_02031 [Ruminococcaceae bacterium YRB3002]
MANDDEYIMSCFKEFVLTRQSIIKYYEMDAEKVNAFNRQILSVKRNAYPNQYPDFIGELMDVEVFNVTSSAENNRKGSLFSKENDALKKRMEEALKPADNPEEYKMGTSHVEIMDYSDHSYENWLKSLKRNIVKHKESRLKYDPEGKECAFLVHYTQKVLGYKDENGVEQWHRLGIDNRALSIIYEELYGSIDYFILLNEMNNEAEVIPIMKIPSYVKTHALRDDFYPRKGAGTIFIGISDFI